MTRGAMSVRLELCDMMPAPSTVACLPSVLADQRMLRPLHSQGVFPRLSETVPLWSLPFTCPKAREKRPYTFSKVVFKV